MSWSVLVVTGISYLFWCAWGAPAFYDWFKRKTSHFLGQCPFEQLSLMGEEQGRFINWKTYLFIWILPIVGSIVILLMWKRRIKHLIK